MLEAGALFSLHKCGLLIVYLAFTMDTEGFSNIHEISVIWTNPEVVLSTSNQHINQPIMKCKTVESPSFIRALAS